MESMRLNVLFGHLKRKNPDIRIQRTSSTQYEFTQDNQILSKQQRDFYEENGYLVIRNMIEPELLDEFCQRFVDLCEGTVPKNNILMMQDSGAREQKLKGEYLINKIHFWSEDPILSKYFRHEKLLKYAECFTGPNIVAFHTMLINKPPDVGTGTSQHPLHQDVPYFPFRPYNTTACAWTAMERTTLENGCLNVIPGTHKLPMLPHSLPETDVNVLFYGVKGFDHVPRVNLLMEKGDTVFFNPLLLHGSGPNLSNGFRKAISCHFVGAECHFIDTEGTVQDALIKILDEGIRNKGYAPSYSDLLRKFARLVRGRNVNFL